MSIWSTIKSYFVKQEKQTSTYVPPTPVPAVRVVDVTTTPPGQPGPQITGGITVTGGTGSRGGGGTITRVTGSAAQLTPQQQAQVAGVSPQPSPQQIAAAAGSAGFQPTIHPQVAQDIKLLERQKLLQETAEKRGRPFTRLEAERFMGGGTEAAKFREAIEREKIRFRRGDVTIGQVMEEEYQARQQSAAELVFGEPPTREELIAQSKGQGFVFLTPEETARFGISSPTTEIGTPTASQRLVYHAEYMLGGKEARGKSGITVLTQKELDLFVKKGIEQQDAQLPVFGSFRTAVQKQTYGEAFKEMFPRATAFLGEKVAPTVSRAYTTSPFNPEKFKAQQEVAIRDSYGAVSGVTTRKFQTPTSLFIAGAPLAIGATPKAFVSMIPVKDILSIGVQQAQAAGRAKTVVAFQTTSGKVGGYVWGTATRTKAGLIKTQLKGVIGKPGKDVLTAREFVSTSAVKVAGKKAVRVVYDSPIIKVTKPAGRITAAAEVGVFKYPAFGKKFVSRYYEVTPRLKPVVYTTPVKTFKEIFRTRGIDIGGTKGRFAAGEVIGEGTYAGFVYTLPKAPSIGRVAVGKGISKSYLITDQTLMSALTKQASVAAVKAANIPKAKTFVKTKVFGVVTAKTVPPVAQITRIPSAYAGTGLYERTETTAVAPPQTFVQTFTRQDIQPVIIQRITPSFRTTTIQKQVPIQRQIESQLQKQVPIQQQLPLQRQLQNVLQKQALLQKQVQLQRQVSVSPRVPIRTLPRPSRGFIPFKLKPSKQITQPFGKFPVFVRRFGVFRPVGFGRTPGEAVAIGENIVSRTLARSFKVPSFKGTKLPGFKTKKEKEGIIFIEPAKRALGTKSEVAEIQDYLKKSVKTR